MKRHSNNKVLIFADNHAPFHHKKTLELFKAIKAEYKPDRVICNGDLTDSYNFSQYAKSLYADSMSHELKRLRAFTAELGSIFPSMVITDSNHDARLWRKAKLSGIPREMLIPYMKFVGAESFDWKLVDDFTFTVDKTREQIHVAHTCSGGTLTASKHMGMSLVLSHHHSKQGVQYWANKKKRFFAVDTGCLIDSKAYAFAYAKNTANKPLLGCTMIIEGQPEIITL